MSELISNAGRKMWLRVVLNEILITDAYFLIEGMKCVVKKVDTF